MVEFLQNLNKLLKYCTTISNLAITMD